MFFRFFGVLGVLLLIKPPFSRFLFFFFCEKTCFCLGF